MHPERLKKPGSDNKNETCKGLFGVPEFYLFSLSVGGCAQVAGVASPE